MFCTAFAGWKLSKIGENGESIPVEKEDLGDYELFRDFVFVTEKTYWKAMIDYKDILFFYHNANHSESTVGLKYKLGFPQ